LVKRYSIEPYSLQSLHSPYMFWCANSISFMQLDTKSISPHDVCL